MKKVVIIGASGHGKVIADIVRAAGDELIGFLDDNPNLNTLGSICNYEKFPDAEFIIAIGNAEIRERISKQIRVKWYTAIHPSAVVSESSEIGEGSVVMANAVINADARVGRHCIINTLAAVEHDNVLEDFVHISVGAKLGGTVKVGKRTWIGIGATVSNNIEICKDVMIGAGAVVIKNVDARAIMIGVPAKLLKYK